MSAVENTPEFLSIFGWKIRKETNIPTLLAVIAAAWALVTWLDGGLGRFEAVERGQAKIAAEQAAGIVRADARQAEVIQAINANRDETNRRIEAILKDSTEQRAKVDAHLSTLDQSDASQDAQIRAIVTEQGQMAMDVREIRNVVVEQRSITR